MSTVPNIIELLEGAVHLMRLNAPRRAHAIDFTTECTRGQPQVADNHMQVCCTVDGHLG